MKEKEMNIISPSLSMAEHGMGPAERRSVWIISTNGRFQRRK
jgi:hypothetical protein